MYVKYVCMKFVGNEVVFVIRVTPTKVRRKKGEKKIFIFRWRKEIESQNCKKMYGVSKCLFGTYDDRLILICWLVTNETGRPIKGVPFISIHVMT